MKTLGSFTFSLLSGARRPPSPFPNNWLSRPGVILPAWAEAEAPLTLEVRLDTLPQDFTGESLVGCTSFL